MPQAVVRRLGLSPEDLRREHWRLTDPHLLEIAAPALDRGPSGPSRPLVAYKYSPLVADPMGLLFAEMGLGEPSAPAFLSRDTAGKPLPGWSEADRALIAERSVAPWLAELEEACRGQLQSESLAALVTLRSFSTDPGLHEKDRRRPRPQICLGASASHTPEGLAFLAGTIFRALGLWPQLGWPLAAAEPPPALAALGRLKVLSLGLRRDLYLDERTGRIKEDGRAALARVLRIFFNLLAQELDRVAQLRLRRAFPPKKASSVIKDPKAKPEAARDKAWLKPRRD
jgi:hypothetical protein